MEPSVQHECAILCPRSQRILSVFAMQFDSTTCFQQHTKSFPYATRSSWLWLMGSSVFDMSIRLNHDLPIQPIIRQTVDGKYSTKKQKISLLTHEEVHYCLNPLSLTLADVASRYWSLDMSIPHLSNVLQIDGKMTALYSSRRECHQKDKELARRNPFLLALRLRLPFIPKHEPQVRLVLMKANHQILTSGLESGVKPK
jgi:hypothetical protein